MWEVCSQTVSIHTADVSLRNKLNPWGNHQGITFIIVTELVFSVNGQKDTYFTSKTRARIPAAIGAALDVPGKCVTQPSAMLVTVTCRHNNPTCYITANALSVHAVQRWVHVSCNMWLLLWNGFLWEVFWKRMQLCSKSSQKNSHTVALTVSVSVSLSLGHDAAAQCYSDDN